MQYILFTASTSPKEIFDQLYFITAPILDSTKQHFSKFTEVYRSVPTEKDKPEN